MSADRSRVAEMITTVLNHVARPILLDAEFAASDFADVSAPTLILCRNRIDAGKRRRRRHDGAGAAFAEERKFAGLALKRLAR